LMTKKEIKAKMKKFINRHTKQEISDDYNFFTGGLIGSLAAVEMISYIEHEFNVTVGNEDLDLSNFNSLNAISEFVTRKKNEN
jgi:methoxymalonate biosynthesis acyl carrier protein